jgi:DNA-binding transcriptional ArsR family regulator
VTTNHSIPSTTLDALGDATRRDIVGLLTAGPVGVRQLSEALPVSRSAVSQHLKVLKDAALVTDDAVGTRRIYRLDPTGFNMLRTYLDAMWRDSLTAYEKAAHDLANSHEEQKK